MSRDAESLEFLGESRCQENFWAGNAKVDFSAPDKVERRSRADSTCQTFDRQRHLPRSRSLCVSIWRVKSHYACSAQ